jgi:hypothetical protein
VLEIGELQINVAGEQARWHGKLIPLRPNEFRVLRFMAENPNRVLTRQELVDALGKAATRIPAHGRRVDQAAAVRACRQRGWDQVALRTGAWEGVCAGFAVETRPRLRLSSG